MSGPIFAKADAEREGRALGVAFDAFSPDDLRVGMDVELEHGKRAGPFNITNDDPTQTAKIALAHLSERGDYYERLEGVEGPAIIITWRDFTRIIIAAAIIIAIIVYWQSKQQRKLATQVPPAQSAPK